MYSENENACEGRHYKSRHKKVSCSRYYTVFFSWIQGDSGEKRKNLKETGQKKVIEETALDKSGVVCTL